MSSSIVTSFTAPYHILKKKTIFNSMDRYHQFINWISDEFDLYLQDESNGLHVFFPEGKFYIKNEIDNGKIIAEINLECKVLENGRVIFEKIMSVYNLLLKN